MEPTPEDVKQYIAQGLDCERVEVDGDGRHFQALVVSAAFAGRNRVARHQLVYAALGERMKAIEDTLSRLESALASNGPSAVSRTIVRPKPARTKRPPVAAGRANGVA